MYLTIFIFLFASRNSSISMIYDKKGSTFLNGGKAMKYIFLLMLSLGGSIPCCFAGKMYTPLEKTYKVACIAEHLKKASTQYEITHQFLLQLERRLVRVIQSFLFVVCTTRYFAR